MLGDGNRGNNARLVTFMRNKTKGTREPSFPLLSVEPSNFFFSLCQNNLCNDDTAIPCNSPLDLSEKERTGNLVESRVLERTRKRKERGNWPNGGW